jgi:leucyl aminopeptidase
MHLLDTAHEHVTWLFPHFFMLTNLDFQPIETVACDALIVVGFETTPPIVSAGAELYESNEFAGKPLDLALLHRPVGLQARRLLLIGGGKPDKFNAALLRRSAGAALRHLKSKSFRNIAMLLDTGFSGAEHVAAAVEGAILGDFESDALKSDKKDVKTVDRFTVVVPAEMLDSRLRGAGERYSANRKTSRERW